MVITPGGALAVAGGHFAGIGLHGWGSKQSLSLRTFMIIQFGLQDKALESARGRSGTCYGHRRWGGLEQKLADAFGWEAQGEPGPASCARLPADLQNDHTKQRCTLKSALCTRILVHVGA